MNISFRNLTLALAFVTLSLASITSAAPWKQNDFVLKRENNNINNPTFINHRRRMGRMGELSRRRKNAASNIFGSKSQNGDQLDIQSLKIGRVVNYGHQRMVVVTDEAGDKRMYPCSFFQWTLVKGCSGRRRAIHTVKIPSF